MKWKEGKDPKKPQGDVEEIDYLDDEAYSPWRKGSGSGTFFDLFKPSYIIGAVVIFVVLIIAATLIPKGGSGSDDKTIKDMDARLRQVEARLAKIEGSAGSGVPAAKLDEQVQQVDRLKTRLDRLETSLAQRVDDLAKQMHKPEPKPAAGSAGPSAAPKESLPPVVKSTTAKGRTHQVQAGETLYSLSRRYSVPVETLCRLNNIPAAQCNAYQVKLGEKLVVGD